VQAIRCSMTGLEAFGEEERTFNALITHVLGKTCEVHFDKRYWLFPTLATTYYITSSFLGYGLTGILFTA